VAEKLALGGATVVLVGVGLTDVFSGIGEREVAVGRAEERDGLAEGAEDRERAEEGDGEGEADNEGEIGTCGIDGSATLGWTSASAGPTARTATQTTSMTRTAAAALRKIRAGPNGRAECFAGKRATPSVI
jgi:hypothetical protein